MQLLLILLISITIISTLPKLLLIPLIDLLQTAHKLAFLWRGYPLREALNAVEYIQAVLFVQLKAGSWVFLSWLLAAGVLVVDVQLLLSQLVLGLHWVLEEGRCQSFLSENVLVLTLRSGQLVAILAIERLRLTPIQGFEDISFLFLIARELEPGSLSLSLR